MTVPTRLVDALADHVERLGACPDACRAARQWASLDPTLRPFPSPAVLAATARAAGPTIRDRLLDSLLRVGAGDEWAELTALAILAPRLAWVVGNWARAGVAGADLDDAEADLVAECCVQVRAASGAQPPDAPGLALVDQAWSRVSIRRSTQRRRCSHEALGVIIEPGTDGDPRSGLDLLAAAIARAQHEGRLGAGSARALFLTRVVGVPTSEAARLLGTTPGSVRMLRSRAVSRLGVERDRRARREAA